MQFAHFFVLTYIAQKEGFPVWTFRLECPGCPAA